MNNEPVILGKIKRGKTGKPLVVLILFLFIGIFILFLPSISGYFGDNNILELIKNGQVIDFFINHDNYVDKPINNKTTTVKIANEPILINNKTVIEFSNITLRDFDLTSQHISFIVSVSSELNFEISNYYFVLEKDNKVINYIKLVNGNNEFKFLNELENTLEVKGYVKIIRENEYPTFTIRENVLNCKKDNKNYEYTFSNNLLIKVKENYIYSNEDLNEYYKEYQNYTNNANKINENNGIADITENINGFIFNSEIDLTTFTGELEKNYYSLNTKSNKINFEMKAKGYDCR